AVRAGANARLAVGLAFPGSRAGRGAGAYVCRPCAAGDHADRQHDGHRYLVDHAAPDFGSVMSEKVAAAPFPLPESTSTPDLRRDWGERRALRSTILTVGAWVVAVIGAVPLFSVLYMLIVQGGSRLSLDLFTELPPAGFELGGGFGNAIVGTL